MQNRATRVITGDGYETRSHEILNKSSWELFRKENKMIAYMTKVTKKQCHDFIAEMFTFANNESQTYELISNNQKVYRTPTITTAE